MLLGLSRSGGCQLLKTPVKTINIKNGLIHIQGGEFEVYTQKLIAIVNKNAEQTTQNIREKMIEAFKRSVIFELDFFVQCL